MPNFTLDCTYFPDNCIIVLRTVSSVGFLFGMHRFASIGLIGTLVILLGMAPHWTAAQNVGSVPSGTNPTLGIHEIPLSLMEDGQDAIVRQHTQRLEVEEVGEARLHVRRAVTVFNRSGREKAATLYLMKDAFREIDALDGLVLDAQGSEIASLRDDQIRDVPAHDGFSLYTDRRIVRAQMHHDSYPHTLVYAYTLNFNGHIDWPAWRVQRESMPVQYAHYEVDVPHHIAVNHEVRNGTLEPTLRETEERRQFRWTVRDMMPFEAEPVGPPPWQQALAVHVSPQRFAIEETEGELTSWAAFGRWYHDLYTGKHDLSAMRTAEARNRVADASTRRDSVRLLYEYMQDHTRYVSVQLGIGGWKPFPARYVERTSYGDCKALTNYMHALLDAVGIPAHPVLIYAGSTRRPLHEDRPTNAFNHMILAVPTEQDTLWLETTSQTVPFGHLPNSIEDRDALLVKADSSHLVRMPASSARDNQRTRRLTVDLSKEGTATLAGTTTYTGNEQDAPRRYLAHASTQEQRDWLRDHLDLPSFEIVEADFSEAAARTTSLSIPMKLEAPRYATVAGDRLFVPLDPITPSPSVPPSMEGPRIHPVHAAPYPHATTDSIAYRLPDGYTVEALPEDVVIEEPFATYRVTVDRPTRNELVYRRMLEVDRDISPSNAYADYRAFRQMMAGSQRMQAVLVRE